MSIRSLQGWLWLGVLKYKLYDLMPEKRDQKETEQRTPFGNDSSDNSIRHLSNDLSKLFCGDDTPNIF